MLLLKKMADLLLSVFTGHIDIVIVLKNPVTVRLYILYCTRMYKMHIIKFVLSPKPFSNRIQINNTSYRMCTLVFPFDVCFHTSVRLTHCCSH